ncbi:MAG: helix-turn-helix domain-containing protein [Gammaproteobacteria bacterium]|nr:helix-turn-helix domain-containing protein [Gammaproteobacteria bacterium]
MDIKRAYRFRFYPTPDQEVILTRTFGCALCRQPHAASALRGLDECA